MCPLYVKSFFVVIHDMIVVINQQRTNIDLLDFDDYDSDDNDDMMKKYKEFLYLAVLSWT